ncbi:unnamed protein product [Chrysoparadoxa australica]
MPMLCLELNEASGDLSPPSLMAAVKQQAAAAIAKAVVAIAKEELTKLQDGEEFLDGEQAWAAVQAIIEDVKTQARSQVAAQDLDNAEATVDAVADGLSPLLEACLIKLDSRWKEEQQRKADALNDMVQQARAKADEDFSALCHGEVMDSEAAEKEVNRIKMTAFEAFFPEANGNEAKDAVNHEAWEKFEKEMQTSVIRTLESLAAFKNAADERAAMRSVAAQQAVVSEALELCAKSFGLLSVGDPLDSENARLVVDWAKEEAFNMAFAEVGDAAAVSKDAAKKAFQEQVLPLVDSARRTLAANKKHADDMEEAKTAAAKAEKEKDEAETAAAEANALRVDLQRARNTADEGFSALCRGEAMDSETAEREVNRIKIAAFEAFFPEANGDVAKDAVKDEAWEKFEKEMQTSVIRTLESLAALKNAADERAAMRSAAAQHAVVSKALKLAADAFGQLSVGSPLHAEDARRSVDWAQENAFNVVFAEVGDAAAVSEDATKKAFQEQVLPLVDSALRGLAASKKHADDMEEAKTAADRAEKEKFEARRAAADRAEQEISELKKAAALREAEGKRERRSSFLDYKMLVEMVAGLDNLRNRGRRPRADCGGSCSRPTSPSSRSISKPARSRSSTRSRSPPTSSPGRYRVRGQFAPGGGHIKKTGWYPN